MVKMTIVDPDSAEGKLMQQQREEELKNFLQRHSFEGMRERLPPRPRSESTVSFESLTPMEVAEQTGKNLMVELLEEQGVRKASKASSALRELRQRSSLFSLASAASSPEASPTSSKESFTWKSCLKKSSWERAAEGQLFTVLV